MLVAAPVQKHRKLGDVNDVTGLLVVNNFGIVYHLHIVPIWVAIIHNC